jgi:hypothetical protein
MKDARPEIPQKRPYRKRARAEAAETGRRRLLAELIALCDVYFWKLFRRDLGLSREQTAPAIRETILALKGKA